MAEASEFVGLICTHLGGHADILWLIKIDQRLKGEPTGITQTVRANGGRYARKPSSIRHIAGECLVLYALTG